MENMRLILTFDLDFGFLNFALHPLLETLAI